MNRKRRVSTRKKKAILSAVAAGVWFSGLFLPQTAGAVDQVTIGWDGKAVFDVKYYGASDSTKDRADFFQQFVNVKKGYSALAYDLTGDIKNGLNKSFRWWAEILGPGATMSQPAQYFVGTFDEENAGALAYIFKNGVETSDPHLFKEIFQSGQRVPQFDDVAAFMRNKNEYEKNGVGFGTILIGQYVGYDDLHDGGYGFVNSVYEANPTPLILSQVDIAPIMFHEIGHSLGISSHRDKIIEQTVSGKKYTLYGFKDFDETGFEAHLYDQYGTRATPNAFILPSKKDLSSVNAVLEANPALKAKFKPEHVFYVPDTAESKKDGKIYLYFAGKHVTDVLDGKTFTRGDGQQISGIPVNTWEYGVPNLSHLELARSMMSHQLYRSYVNFMEAELAALQDIGYQIDRKNFYGRSIYNDGLTLTNEQGFSARKDGRYVDGYNTATFGIGLHVYGSNNTITQAGNVFAKGAGAVGIRVDGVNNTITVPKGTEIHADGSYNDGILIAYGKNHRVNVEGTVTATGESGNALSFDFGSNAIGTSTEYRGSFFRYRRGILNNVVYEAKNIGLNEIYNDTDAWSFSDVKNSDLNAPMVNTVNISGKLIANPETFGNAIYIDSTAFVDTININDGAEIKGNIHSQWKHFTPHMGIYDYETPVETKFTYPDGTRTKLEGLMLQYKGGVYPYTKYIPDLVTKLNFNTTMAYDGDIDGMDNMKINVNGNLVYGGSADVVSVNVAEGAGLFGGTFTVNDMSGKMAAGFSDDTTGKFFNHGTIGSAYSDRSMTIRGRLISDGTLSGYGGGALGDIVVKGAAAIDGSKISAVNMLPDETMTVLKADSVTGQIRNDVGNPVEISGLLKGYGTVSGKDVKFTSQYSDNLGELSASQREALGAVNAMLASLNQDSRKSELRKIYNLDAGSTKRALDQIGYSPAPQMMSAVQAGSVANRVISDRLSAAFLLQEVNADVPVPVKYFGEKVKAVQAGSVANRAISDRLSAAFSPQEVSADVPVPVNRSVHGAEDKALTVPVKLEVPVQADNDVWVKFTKNWGELKGDADYHGQAISGGYDRAIGKHWRGGLFVSYDAKSLGADHSGGNMYDTRFGVYGGYHRNADDAFIYMDGGRIRNKLHRSIPALGLGTEAKYHSNIFEIGGEYRHNLQPERTWQISPFVNLQYSSMKQEAFAETGAGIFNHHVDAKRNNYFAGQLGVEFKRQLRHGHYAARIGVKYAFAGADPALSFSYEGDAGHAYRLENNQDKTHVVLSIGGENEFAHGWMLGGDVQLQKGRHDRDVSASVMVRKVW